MLISIKKINSNLIKDYNAYELIKSLNINICPYCNRNGIHNLKKSKRTSELDHFHPQSKYPFLAISFYNLIPSCKVCNKIKLDKDNKKYINPYDDRFDFNKNMKFTLKIKDSTFLFSENGFELKYRFAKNVSPDEKKRIVNNRKDFELKDLYSNHKDIVLELIQKREIYPDSYIDDLFHQYEGTLFKNREDVLRHITGGYIDDKDINKRPLSKLIKDISEELDLI
ncbi:MAG: HNH endonuclease [Aliarcobacter sp.]|nr:HNH endonuclease [Aliarcobacter sp.]